MRLYKGLHSNERIDVAHINKRNYFSFKLSSAGT